MIASEAFKYVFFFASSAVKDSKSLISVRGTVELKQEQNKLCEEKELN